MKKEYVITTTFCIQNKEGYENLIKTMGLKPALYTIEGTLKEILEQQLANSLSIFANFLCERDKDGRIPNGRFEEKFKELESQYKIQYNE